MKVVKAATVKRGEYPDYIECECGNEPHAGLGFYVSDKRGVPFEGQGPSRYIACEECEAVFDSTEIEAAVEGEFVESVFHECPECATDLTAHWHQPYCSVYADAAQDAAAGE